MAGLLGSSKAMSSLGLAPPGLSDRYFSFDNGGILKR
jgi:hypothetical protein